MPDSTFDWHDTPDPTQRLFSFVAKEPPTALTIPDFLNSSVTWATCPKWVKEAEKVPSSLQGWRLVHAQKAGFQQRRFYFAEIRTTSQRRTPFKTRWVKRMHSWPTVLLNLWFEEGNLPLSAVDSSGNIQSAKRVHERVRYRPGNMYPTWFRIRHYLADTPFGKKNMQTIPITDSIQWSFDGSSGSFPECLHPGAKFTAYQTSGAVVFGCGTPEAGGVGSDLVVQEYPPTPMRDWQKHVIEDTRNEVMGTMEHRILVEAFAPLDTRDDTIS